MDTLLSTTEKPLILFRAGDVTGMLKPQDVDEVKKPFASAAEMLTVSLDTREQGNVYLSMIT